SFVTRSAAERVEIDPEATGPTMDLFAALAHRLRDRRDVALVLYERGGERAANLILVAGVGVGLRRCTRVVDDGGGPHARDRRRQMREVDGRTGGQDVRRRQCAFELTHVERPVVLEQ